MAFACFYILDPTRKESQTHTHMSGNSPLTPCRVGSCLIGGLSIARSGVGVECTKIHRLVCKRGQGEIDEGPLKDRPSFTMLVHAANQMGAYP